MLWVTLTICAVSSAQTASPFYLHPCEVDPSRSTTICIGNILCFNNKREFPNKKSSLTDEEKQSTDLGIGGTYAGDYYTMALHVPETGAYKLEVDACHKQDERSLWVYRSANPLGTLGQTDADVEYALMGEQKMPITGGWNKYQKLTYKLTLEAGYNLVKIVFDKKYGGNVGGIRILRDIPPSPQMMSVLLNGKDILADFDEDDTFTHRIPRGNPLPAVTATANELATVEISQATTNNMTTTICLYQKTDHKLLHTYKVKFEYVDIVYGYDFTWTTGDGTTDKTYHDGIYHAMRESETNPAFKIVGSNDIYSDNRFKVKAGERFALRIPRNAVVSKVTFLNCYEAYYDKGATDSEWDYVKSEGAASSISNDGKIDTGKDIEVTFTNHQAGSPIELSVKKCSNVAWEKIKIEYAQINDNNIEYLGCIAKDGEDKAVSGSFRLNFDRNVSATKEANVTMDGKKIRYKIIGASLTAYYWDLLPAAQHIFKVAANSVEDIFKNKYDTDISISFTTEAEKKVNMANYDYVVGTAEELASAVKAVNESNAATDAPRKRIFIKNGDYVMDTTEKYEEHSGKPAILITANNVSLIGQSQDGVLIRSLCTNDGQGTAVIEIRGKNTYFQDMTIRTADFRTPQFVHEGKSYGRLLAVYVNRGQRTIMKHICLQGNQDTYLCGHRSYHENCTIHGTVDFIYAGGDNFFKNNTIVMENGGVIAAPGTNSSQQWGMVFDSCTIKAGTAPNTTYEGYSLARPWQGEPRCYWLNTRMEILPSVRGWRPMGKVLTHFYEYKSMDAEGNLLDLSKRGNSESSLNAYVPILNDEDAKEFTVNNVLGGEDGWMPDKLTKLPEAPAITLQESELRWKEVENALCYVVFADGKYLASTTATSYNLPSNISAKSLKLYACNEMGGLGRAAEVAVPTAIDHGIRSQDSVNTIYYNLQGQRVSAPRRGLVIRVDCMPDGSKQIIKSNH